MDVKAQDPSPALLAEEGAGHQKQISHTFQRGQVYRTIEDFNKQAKHGEDACCKLLESLATLPQRCLTPCSIFSACLSFIVLVLYLIGIIWLCVYDIYDITYVTHETKSQTTSIVLQCDESVVLNNTYVCEYYGFEECGASGDSTHSNASLSPLDSSSMLFIKIQFFIAWIMWCRLRFIMKDMSIFSVTYIFLMLFCNVISYMFRHLGWIYNEDACKILYSPYFSHDFVNAIVSFIAAFVCWIVFVGICLKRVTVGGRYGHTKLIVRWKGNVVDRNQGIVDNCSVATNIAIWLLFAYSAGGSSLWIGIENYTASVQKLLFDHENTGSYRFTSWMNLVEWFGTTIIQYFVPKIHWISVYVFAALATNLLLIVDICIFFLKVIRDLMERCKKN
eukprot:73735_1